ncbi:hypothetical protein B0H21DRAFT_709889 [Amylocystis lapponica]|nr:hypothetical protein B0H21DRAFT_709889 [Amylocystis lapponica]
MSTCLLIVLSAALVPLARAASNGMDMNMDGAMSLASGQMLPYFHFTLGDMLWFQGWVPATAGRWSNHADNPPFNLVHDVVRAVLFVVQSALHFTFMLAIMTCQLGFIFSIIIGFGTGEMLFGRFGAHGEPGRGPA